MKKGNLPEDLVALGQIEHVDIQNLDDLLSVIYAAIESSINAVIITDLDGGIIYVNQAFLKMFDYSDRQSLMGMNAAELFASREIRSLSDAESIIDASSRDIETFRALRENNQTIFVDVSTSKVANQEGKVVGRMASFIDITDRKHVEEEREILIKQLQDALDKIKTLRGLLPICASCKKIRDDSGYWHQIEAYVELHSEAVFSHGICPECMQKLYPELADKIARSKVKTDK